MRSFQAAVTFSRRAQGGGASRRSHSKPAQNKAKVNTKSQTFIFPFYFCQPINKTASFVSWRGQTILFCKDACRVYEAGNISPKTEGEKGLSFTTPFNQSVSMKKVIALTVNRIKKFSFALAG